MPSLSGITMLFSKEVFLRYSHKIANVNFPLDDVLYIVWEVITAFDSLDNFLDYILKTHKGIHMRTIFVTVALAIVSYHSVGLLIQQSKVVGDIHAHNQKIEIKLNKKLGDYND